MIGANACGGGSLGDPSPHGGKRARFWRVLVVAAAALGALSALCAPALAGKGVVAIFGEEGTGAGQFAFPSGVAVNQSTGDLYVADPTTEGAGNGQRILQFAADGSFIRAWGWGVATGANAFEICTTACQAGIPGSGDGQFSLQLGNIDLTSPQIAVDQSDGSVYVADNLNDRIQKFTSSGAYVGQFGGSGSGDGQLSLPQGVAVDPVSGDVYVADANNNRVQRFDSSGVYQSQLGTPGGGTSEGDFIMPTRVAVDSSGRLYVLDQGNARVQRFTSAGSFDQVFAAGSYNSPRELAVDPADDHVYIAADNADFTARGILEFDPDGVAVDIHALEGEGLRLSSTGLAIRSSTGRIYVSNPFSPKAVLILDDVALPAASIDPATDIFDTSATLHGSVNSQGPPNTRYHFEYSVDGATWVRASAQDLSVGSGTSDVPVSQVATGLAPNTEYRARLVATKDFNAGRSTSSETTFTTDTAPPLVLPLAAGPHTDTAAWLGSEVNPQSLPTTYYVEYTVEADGSYSQSSRVPAPPSTGDAGSGGTFVTVSQLVSGLKPATEYRFRVVAENAAGVTEGADRTFVTQAAVPQPPVGRGYEMVSPLDKNGGNVDRDLPVANYATSGAAPSGDAVAYASQAQFGELESGPPYNMYRSARTDEGWRTKGISPPIKPEPSLPAVTPAIWFLSDDLTKSVVGTGASLTDEAEMLSGSYGLYLQDNTTSPLSHRMLSVPWATLPQDEPVSQSAAAGRFSFVAASEDMRHVLFESEDRPLTADASPTGNGVYEWIDGQVRLVSKLPSGAPALDAAAGRSALAGQYFPGDHLMSEDGNRVFFMDGGSAPPQPLYVREGGTSTRVVSASEAPGGDPTLALPATFQAAKADDGSLALFTSGRQLTADATAQGGSCSSEGPLELCHDDLYLWNADAPEGARLTDLTTADPEGGGVVSIAAAAEDLSRVYFVAAGDLAPGAVQGQANLYVWSSSTGVRLVASSVDQSVASVARSILGFQYRDARVTADGSRLLFTSHARLTAADNGGHKQAYLYDFAEDRLVCVSCDPAGEASTADTWLIQMPAMPYRLPRNLSEDASKAFFETAQALDPDDTNGKSDVYMWSDGEIGLISSGKGIDGSKFVDASADGDDVFFTTRERLVASDVDDQVDIYDARVDGGFAVQEVLPPCAGDPCQGPFSMPPALPGTSSDIGAGDVAQPPRPAFSVGRLSASGRRALAAGRNASIVARVNRSGRVSVRGVAKVGKRNRTVLFSAKRARSAGRVRLTLRLSKAGRALLTRTDRLRVTLHVRFAGAPEVQARSLMLRSADERRNGR